jgi:hypothetical protein
MRSQLSKLVSSLVFTVGILLVTHCGSDKNNEEKSAGGNKYSYLFSTSGKATPGVIYGTWIANQKQGNVEVESRIRFEQNKMIMANRCKFNDGSTSIVAVETGAVIDSKTFRPLESKEDSVYNKQTRCRVFIEAGTYDYSIKGLNLQILNSRDIVTITKSND